MNHPDPWTTCFNDTPLQPWLNEQLSLADKICSSHGDYIRWHKTLQQLSQYATDKFNLSLPAIQIGREDKLGKDKYNHLNDLLYNLHPWRKGPFNVFGVEINSEWRSDFKWQRLADKISPLKSRKILDVGCGNGYFMLRMLGEGAKCVLGIDPAVLYNMQFRALSRLIAGNINAAALPIGIDDLPDDLACFDNVFSMGILYHRRSPIDHLSKLYSCLRPGGELVLETLVLDESEEKLLVPHSRYAKMRNVWFIPTTTALTIWLHRTGFNNIKLVDVSTTSREEQRSTDWMKYESLSDFLDPGDQSKTIEGHPAPTRAIFVASR
ncbi:MAG: tRNA 5-methoxyuridine(34)/uridine 5-oxyacetic acid(34) synthase CmoB [Gammaproteobacteria bacterium]|nr:MAG: tRNA 5-methoxyuridine(34)/uridine 5-oxyacetic acid(34) synthase CmoB [Gammaproteobacteria bacterium]